VFTAASLAIGLAPSAAWLLTARAGAALTAGAVLLALALAVVLIVSPQGSSGLHSSSRDRSLPPHRSTAVTVRRPAASPAGGGMPPGPE
jgi:hypothetical protein